jgi:peroxiredoxin-like protein
MDPYPHHYPVTATASAEGPVSLSSEGLPPLESAAPSQFGGPGDRWSPETLLVAAAADCVLLTFRAVARASKLSWERIACDAEGTLDRVEGVTRFTALHFRVRVAVPAGTGADRARRLVEKAERSCLISRSLAFEPTLEVDVQEG